MFDSQASRQQFAPEDLLPFANKGESEVLVGRMSKVDCMSHIPDLTQRRSTVACPLEEGRWAPTRSCPGAVVGRTGPLIFGQEGQFDPRE